MVHTIQLLNLILAIIVVRNENGWIVERVGFVFFLLTYWRRWWFPLEFWMLLRVIGILILHKLFLGHIQGETGCGKLGFEEGYKGLVDAVIGK